MARHKNHMAPGGKKMSVKTHDASVKKAINKAHGTTTKKTVRKPPGRMPPADMPISPPAGIAAGGLPPPPIGPAPGPPGAGPVPGLPPRRRRVL